MKFLTGKSFPSFDEWCKKYPNDVWGDKYLPEKLEFREGCIHEAIELSQDWCKLSYEQQQAFSEWKRTLNGYETRNRHKWVAFLLESSLGGNDE